MALTRRGAVSGALRVSSALLDCSRGVRDLLWPPSCAGCAAPLDRSDPAAPETTVLCGACLAPLSAPLRVGGVDVPNGLGLCFAATEFRGAAETWIVRFKYPQPGILGLDPGPRRAAEALIRRSARAVPGPAPDLIVPVPLHPRRLRRRGFNPAGLLAAEVVRARGGRLDPTGLVRVRDTPSQTGLGRRERRRNVDGAFRAPRAVPRRVWLVDDVVTTGATLAACGRALRDAGALDVTAVCAAWTPPRAHVDTSSA